MAARREELGGPPTPEELLAYRDGRLSPEERGRMEERLAVWSDAARTLADIAAFPDIEPAPGAPELSEDDITARWQSFRRRLPEVTRHWAEEEAAAQPRPVSPPAVLPARPQRWRWAPALPLAAAALVGLAVGWGLGTGREGAGPAITTLAELSPVDGVRAAATDVELPQESEALVLILGSDGRDERDYPAYEVEIRDASGRPVWSRQGLRQDSAGTVSLSFPRGFLRPGRYQIDLQGRDGGERTHLATYDFRFLEGAPDS